MRLGLLSGVLVLILLGCTDETGIGGAAGSGGAGGDASTATRHALVFGLDGVRPDALQEAVTPNIDALIANGAVTYDAFAGGQLGTATEQRTLSGPGWTSILTGVWVDKHGVEFNDFAGSQIGTFPHFFRRIREADPDASLASFVTWAPINDQILAPGDADLAFAPSAGDSATGDIEVTEAVVEYVSAETPTVVFVQLDNPDAQGHFNGFAANVPEYVQAIEEADAQVGQMVDAVRSRATSATEEWLFIVTTDHGGLGQLHGGQSEDERIIPLIVSPSTRTGISTESPGHVAIPTIVVEHLGLVVDPAWGWETDAFGL